ncbi:HAMP domain-containing sensor histidine kinase [Arthrobacter sp. CJ23]|uniref:HAMP domain-containing sensor histidine kinase n=1 Tax=Arthrobacter sp. CJ23 TaxID=2972479 RepID=UPI00215CE264|nr:HAMP domain-containing sensor histidine kinase [Arthrobacter sp. CJ23]UVJ40174.1 HAMP domain-containing histidine kinase [Arthrobacter sp. CJ23]
MKVRVLAVLSLLSVVIVIAVSSIILTSAGRELTQEIQINRAAALNRFAQMAYDVALDNDSTQLQREMDAYSGLYGEGILVRLQQGTLRSGGLSEDRADVREALSRAGLNLSDTTIPALQPLGTGTEVISRPFGTANQVLGEAVLEVDPEAARQKLRERWLGVIVAALALGTLLLLAAARVTAWVLRPVHRLNAAVTELETTGRTSRLPEDGPPELRQLSRSFTAMAQTVSESIDSQRRLIADTSHQLRNPVGALRLRIDLLQLELQTGSQKAAAAGVVAELERVEEMLDGVLKLATAEHRAFEGSARAHRWEGKDGADGTGGPESDEGKRPAIIDPFPVLQEEVDRAAPAARTAGAELVLETPTSPLQLACNAEELAHMVGELLTNAIKYAPAARITVAGRPRPGGVAIEVSDDGPGLSPEQRAASTTRFWRAPQHSTIRGNGLGMTIVDRLAEANGARLVLSERPPHGLAARLEFPAPPAQHHPAEPPPGMPPSGASDA